MTSGYRPAQVERGMRHVQCRVGRGAGGQQASSALLLALHRLASQDVPLAGPVLSVGRSPHQLACWLVEELAIAAARRAGMRATALRWKDRERGIAEERKGVREGRQRKKGSEGGQAEKERE